MNTLMVSNQINLTNALNLDSSPWALYPMWSPDGKKIAFVAVQQGGRSRNLYSETLMARIWLTLQIIQKMILILPCLQMVKRLPFCHFIIEERKSLL